MKFETQIYASWKGKQKQTAFISYTPACTPLNAHNFVQTNRVEYRTKCWWRMFFVRCFHVFMVIWVILHENCVTTRKKCNAPSVSPVFFRKKNIFLFYRFFDSADFFSCLFEKNIMKRSMLSFAWVETLNGLICIWKRKVIHIKMCRFSQKLSKQKPLYYRYRHESAELKTEYKKIRSISMQMFYCMFWMLYWKMVGQPRSNCDWLYREFCISFLRGDATLHTCMQ